MSKEVKAKLTLKGTKKTEVVFTTPEGTINTEVLDDVLASIGLDALKSLNNNGAAGRRFRNNTIAMSKVFVELRKLTPVK